MTNKYSAYPHPLPSGLGFWAIVRFCRDSHPSPIMDTGEKPKVFDTKGEAAEECLKHVVAFMNGHEIRGERFEGGTHHDAANSAFPTLQPFVKQKARRVPVERRARA